MPQPSVRRPHLARRLLAWYGRHRRELPWRARPGVAADPYAVWLSEIMLQQTTVAAVKPYFEAFLRRWPTVEALARAPTDDVMTAWAGLGYYARARNLHRCAQTVASFHGGRFPNQEEALLALPGVGPYTAAAIAAIAFDRRAVVVDGNVERVMARMHAVTRPLPAAKKDLYRLADALTPTARAGDYAQAVMDLGATICTPKSPSCERCPWAKDCEGRKQGIAATLPRKIAKTATPTRHGVVFCLTNDRGEVLLQRRPPKGLLGGMMGFPTTDWRAETWSTPAAKKSAPRAARWKAVDGTVEHTFTHFHLKLNVWLAKANKAMPRATDAIWAPIGRLGEFALPNVMRKVVHHVGLKALAQTSARTLLKSSRRKAAHPA
ncbi:MAG: A/G-specific adenine glycosylase [Rhodospirillaceae bacterium]|nr:A/G-specific adenine glycosylase [Rhodospirillaceae bacterium]